MGLLIFLRKRENENWFRKLIVGTIDLGIGNQVILCSGFFQEKQAGRSFEISKEANLISILNKHKIELTTIGVHNNAWINSYKNFKDELLKNGVKIIAKRSKKLRWHSKVFIVKKDGNPLAAIIGSSNMTRNAFGLTSPFNYETDVFIWLDKYKSITNFVNNLLILNSDFANELIVADYDPEKNWGLTIETRLNNLNNEFENNDLFNQL